MALIDPTAPPPTPGAGQPVTRIHPVADYITGGSWTPPAGSPPPTGTPSVGGRGQYNPFISGGGQAGGRVHFDPVTGWSLDALPGQAAHSARGQAMWQAAHPGQTWSMPWLTAIQRAHLPSWALGGGPTPNPPVQDGPIPEPPIGPNPYLAPYLTGFGG